MFSTMGSRIEWVKRQKGISNQEIGDEFGITKEAIRGWIQRNVVPEKHIKKLSIFLQVDEDWLRFGVGDTPDIENLTSGSRSIPPSISAHQLGIRFYSEMLRLQLNLEEMETILNMNRKKIEEFILGYKSITAEIFMKLIQSGFDINYILSGKSVNPEKNNSQTTNNINIGDNHLEHSPINLHMSTD